MLAARHSSWSGRRLSSGASPWHVVTGLEVLRHVSRRAAPTAAVRPRIALKPGFGRRLDEAGAWSRPVGAVFADRRSVVARPCGFSPGGPRDDGRIRHRGPFWRPKLDK